MITLNISGLVADYCLDSRQKYKDSDIRHLTGFLQLLAHETGETELLLKSDAIMKVYKNGQPNLDEDGWLHTGIWYFNTEYNW